VLEAAFDFAEAGTAQEILTKRRNIGKVVLVPEGL
jgi:hypothetical protein